MRVLATFRGGLASRSRELPRDFRGICVRRALMPTGQQPHNSRASPLYPQRDSNPCRHLERDSRRGRSERQRTERARFRGIPGHGERGQERRVRAAAGFSRYRRGRHTVVRSRHCYAVFRCLATANLPRWRRHIDTPTESWEASGDSDAFGTQMDLHRHTVALTLDHTGSERGLVTIADPQPVPWNRGEVRVVCTWAMADPALDHHISAGGVRVEPEVVELGSHVDQATGGGRPIQVGFSIGSSKCCAPRRTLRRSERRA